MGKWDSKPIVSEATPKPLIPNVNKWLRAGQQEINSGASSSTYQPNLSKWARPAPVDQPRSSILRGLDDPTQTPRRSRSSTPRTGERRDAAGGVKWAPKFPSPNPTPTPTRTAKSSATVLDREEAPHLVKSQTLPNLRDEKLRSSVQTRESDQADLEEGPSFRRSDVGREEESVEVVEVQDDAGGGFGARSRRPQREGLKTRGSVVERLKTGQSVQIPRHPRVNSEKFDARKKTKRVKEAKRVNLDVYIPSIISVGNLGQLLGVRLGGYHSC